MKIVFNIVLVFLYLCDKTVNCAVKFPESNVKVDPIEYGDEGKFFKKGDVIRIHCRSTSKRHKVDWYYPSGDIVPRQSTNRVYVQEHPKAPRLVKPSDHILTITKAATEDTGVWECRSKGAVEKVEICVIDPAEFEERKEEEVVDEGRSLSLTCQAKGDPEPMITWYKDDELITEETKDHKYIIGSKFTHRGLEGFLTIKSIQADDQGVYTCVAEQRNNIVEHCSHESSMNITLNVYHAPRFEDDNDRPFIFTEKDEEVSLYCEPSAYPAPKFRWFRELDSKGTGIFVEFPEKDFVVFGNSTYSVLTLKTSSLYGGEKFVCKVENFYGKASKTYFLKRNVPPSSPDLISVLDSTSSEIKFNISWYDDIIFPVTVIQVQYFEKKASFSPTKEVHWSSAEELSIDDAAMAYDDEPRFSIKDLDADTEYWMRVRVGNSAGLSSWTPPLLVATTEEEFGRPMAVIEEGFVFGDLFFGLVLSAIILAAGGGCILVMKRL